MTLCLNFAFYGVTCSLVLQTQSAHDISHKGYQLLVQLCETLKHIGVFIRNVKMCPRELNSIFNILFIYIFAKL